MYLAAAGVGTLAVIDYDTVDLSNLQRQLLHMTRDVGRRKIESAGERLRAINSEIRVEVYDSALTPANALDLVRAYDVTVDGSDNFPTRYLTNDACVLTARPSVYGSIFRFEGQVSVFASPGGPCYRCLFPDPPAPELVPSCAEAGVLGVVPGIVGTIQAAEAIKLVLGLGDSLAGRLLLFDAVKMRFREVAVRRDPTCPVCGDAPSIRGLQDYEAFCGAPHVPGEAERSGPDEEGFEITVTELNDGLRSGLRPVLLDVRETMEARINGLEGALLIPLQELPARLSELSPTMDYVVYCHHGSRSARAVEILRAAGLRARSLRGGIVAWANEVDTAMLRY
jgi:adenylyltransferase/sulfurtransferase